MFSSREDYRAIAQEDPWEYLSYLSRTPITELRKLSEGEVKRRIKVYQMKHNEEFRRFIEKV